MARLATRFPLSRRAAAVTALTIVMAAASLGCGAGEPAKGTVPGVALNLELQRTVAAPGQTIGATLANRGSVDLETGATYQLQRRSAQGWQRVPTGKFFRFVVYPLPSGESDTRPVRLPRNLEPGPYRVVRTAYVASAKPPSEAHRASARLQVR